jgi:hypothetical protein
LRKAIALGSVFVLLVLVSVCLHAPESDAPDGSPAFRSMLNQAIDRLEKTSQRITAATVPVAHALTPTVDEYTCSGFRTCDAMQTCDGTITCDGEITCWASTCLENVTCQTTCELYTRDQSETCEGGPTCEEACPGWPTYFPGLQTCDGAPTCELTCPGFITCSGCVATERTTWGSIKADFAH